MTKKHRVLVSERIAEEGLAMLRSELEVDYRDGIGRAELLNIIKDYDALIVRSVTQVDEELVAAGTRLKMVGRAGNGIDNIDVHACTRRGIVVANTPDSNTISAAEQTMALMLCSLRHTAEANAFLKAGNWDRKPFRGMELYGKTVGIVGLGRIGSMVATRVKSFGTRVIAYDPYIPDERFERFGAEKKETLEELVREADIITVHTPRNEETMGMIGAREFAMAKDGVRVVNCARGGIISEAALVEALKSGKVGSAGLDVFEEEPARQNPLFAFKNVVVTPHLGADTVEAQRRVGVTIAEQVIKGLRGELVPNVVNLPTVLRSELEVLSPYIELAEKMGSLYYQMERSPVDRIELSFSGDIAQQETGLLTIAFLKGLLSGVMSEKVNYVNARIKADERGIKVFERKEEKQVKGYVNLISAKVFNRGHDLQVAGTLTGAGRPYIVEINDFETDMFPVGNVLIAINEDRPGVIGPFTTELGKAGINISMMRVGSKGSMNLMVVNVDGEVDERTLARLRAVDGIVKVHLVRFR
ncbi:MAG: phosphoglycerate dehydrogenase [Syntrophomonadaceae bacterium]|jgi:D-3-phosphoglycerate dehydrogenase|nr:phosphoglycerate dehydrogenase [Syntrophomonadaceae bacterium]MDH7497417.1 phosphoglycerate dehydrogenase [Syntrophomonadaceae bacterium]